MWRERERERESSSACGPSGRVERESLEARVRAPGDASERAYGTSRHELGSSRAEGRRGEGSRNSLSLFFYGFCVNACGKAPSSLCFRQFPFGISHIISFLFPIRRYVDQSFVSNISFNLSLQLAPQMLHEKKKKRFRVFLSNFSGKYRSEVSQGSLTV